MKTWVVTYIGLPDVQYKEVTVWANDAIEARSEADIKILEEYGIDSVDCLEVRQPSFHDN